MRTARLLAWTLLPLAGMCAPLAFVSVFARIHAFYVHLLPTIFEYSDATDERWRTLYISQDASTAAIFTMLLGLAGALVMAVGLYEEGRAFFVDMQNAAFRARRARELRDYETRIKQLELDCRYARAMRDPPPMVGPLPRNRAPVVVEQ